MKNYFSDIMSFKIAPTLGREIAVGVTTLVLVAAVVLATSMINGFALDSMPPFTLVILVAGVVFVVVRIIIAAVRGPQQQTSAQTLRHRDDWS